MTAVTTPAPTTAPARPGTRPDVEDATRVILHGQLTWLPVVWLGGTLLFGALLVGIGTWGTVDDSLWGAGADWQRYLFFAAGVGTMTTFIRLLVRNGVTRGLVSSGTTVTMAVLATMIGLWNVAGYTIEAVTYHHEGWAQTLGSGHVFGWGDLPNVFVTNALLAAAYYVSGWIVATGYIRFGGLGGTLRALPGLLPAAAMELVVSPDFGGQATSLWVSWRNHVAPMIVIGLALLTVSVIVARRLTRETALS